MSRAYQPVSDEWLEHQLKFLEITSPHTQAMLIDALRELRRRRHLDRTPVRFCPGCGAAVATPHGPDCGVTAHAAAGYDARASLIVSDPAATLGN